jgi:preprotein translocase subunit YajC
MISVAHAQEAASTAANAANAAPGGIVQFLPLIFIFIVAYFLLLRPQMKRAKEHKAVMDNLQKGDEIITQGGLTGRITKVGEGYFALEVSDKVEVTVQRSAVQMVLPKGTLKSVP